MRFADIEVNLDTFLKKIDILVYLPLIFISRIFSILFLWRNKSENVLVVRPGGMGDLVCLTIAMEDVKVSRHQIVFLIQKRAKPWAEHLKLNYIIIGFNALFFKNIYKFNTVINTEQLYGLSQTLASTFITTRGRISGFSSCRGSFLSHKSIPYEPSNMHEVLCFRKLWICSLNISNTPITDKDPIERSRIFSKNSGYLVVGIAGLQAPSRSLSIETWVTLIVRWASGRPVLLVGAPVDTPFIEAIIRFNGSNKWKHLKGEFIEVVQTIRESDRFLTIDGGLVHVASYYGIPTDVIFTSGQYKKWAPLSKDSLIIKNWSIPCSPCTMFGQVPKCPHDFRCKKGLRLQA
jgi:ADP-heptose:LPS heptosyltransferase